ncbi:unnamed protein product [Mesocestoides corti]|uniref:Uncharacterized protein n=1 Tax=Mesocestoides corti TaxID=53468 RepID=A0A0R3U8G6_MESCO|nr:unnamed protein product [Mesocestoides corti]
MQKSLDSMRSEVGGHTYLRRFPRHSQQICRAKRIETASQCQRRLCQGFSVTSTEPCACLRILRSISAHQAIRPPPLPAFSVVVEELYTVIREELVDSTIDKCELIGEVASTSDDGLFHTNFASHLLGVN